MMTGIGLTSAAQYEIRVQGELDTRWQAWFEGMTITPGDGETIIRGWLADQAALHSLLMRIRDLGLPLIAVTYIESETTPPHHI
jgi:hypothetical protein